MRCLLPLWTVTTLLAVGCGGPGTPPVSQGTSGSAVWFVERGTELGLDFVHFNGMSGELYFLEIFGPGVALLDYDNDGDLDLYVTQGRMLGPGKTIEQADFPPSAAEPLTDRLYRNDLTETGELGFTDVSLRAGLAPGGYGMGVAAGDYDSDGWIDLYVTNYGPNRLLRNQGDGTFVDSTSDSGTEDDRWSTSAAFVDFDADQRLDLFVANYVDFTYANHRQCLSSIGGAGYCGPNSYRPQPDRLFRNVGNGRFEDVSESTGIAALDGAGLGVCYADFDDDGRLEIYVSNDLMPNRLWVATAGGRFADRALLAGCAFNADGDAESSMGIDAADFDGDGDEDLFLAHLDNETNTLYLNDGTGWFDDVTFERGLGTSSRDYTGFGAAWIDVDNDGWLDLVVVNGAVKQLEELVRQADPFPLHQRNQLFSNRGDGTFIDLSGSAGPAFELSEVSRGAAFGDLDNDGDTDVVIGNNSGPLRVLINRTDSGNHWIGLRMMDRNGLYDAIGTAVEVRLAGGRSLKRRVRPAASYLSSNDPRILVGLGAHSQILVVRAVWPDGTREEWDPPLIDRYTVLRRGSGRAATN